MFVDSDFSNQNDTYNLSQQILHHKNILRTIACNNKGIVVTGSFDKSCAFFYRTEENGPYVHLRDTNYHDDYVYVVRPEILDRGFFSGSKDAKIIFMDNEGNPLGEFIGHTGTVSDISQSDKDTFISGSWDTTAKIWDINTQKCLFTLKDHSYAVSTLALQNKRYITGSQDKKLKFWDGEKLIKTIENAHDDIIRDIKISNDGMTFYTCSNDYSIKHWTFDGELIEVLTGHEGFVFRLGFARGTNMMFSAGDDRIVKTWKNNKFTQDLFHPNTIWDLAVNPINNDLLTACADGVVRVFSNNPSKWQTQVELEEYTNLCLLSNKQDEDQGNESVDVSKLPKFEDIKFIKNPKEGEIRVFNNQGNAEAYVYKSSERKWDKIGDVLGTKDTKKIYEGDKYFPAGNYDYIFDVDLEGRFSRLPFNKGDNCLVAAEKFINRENLHKGLYVDDITRFLRKNTGQEEPNENGNIQPNTGTGYKKIEPKKPEPRKNIPNSIKFPKTTFTRYDAINTEGPLKKIIEFNTNLASSSHPHAMSNQQIEFIKSFLKKLGSPQFYHTSTFSQNEVDTFIKILGRWPNEYIIPYLDTFRMFLLHPRSNDLFQKIGGGVQELTLILEILKTGSEVQKILVLRILNNMFINEGSRIFMAEKRQEMLDNSSVYLDSENKNIRNAIIGLLLK